MGKAADAFRTISEVAEWLDVPAHVLRFWESKFTQIKPVKRAGGRRYYRPTDMALLGGIKVLLHDQGMTIKGAQKYLRENGIQQVSAMSPPLGDDSNGEESGIALDVETTPARPAEVLAFARPRETEETPEPEIANQSQKDSIRTADQTPEEIPETPSFESAKPDAPASASQTPAQSAGPEPKPEHIPVPASEPEQAAAASEPATPLKEARPKPLTDPALPDDPADDLVAEPGLLTALSTLPRPVSSEFAARLAPLVAALRAQAAHAQKDR